MVARRQRFLSRSPSLRSSFGLGNEQGRPVLVATVVAESTHELHEVNLMPAEVLRSYSTSQKFCRNEGRVLNMMIFIVCLTVKR